ncbi:hypothetical protein [Actinocrispum wychmicini]|uniref:Uncharacterized protein n=1 Tax=Actinocrispum wychmicini TaxID=1213861 RepID=A0A4R2IRK0_9PSEU|nr:hypothetical protein [Actinocrispum wychmicini]TCO46688.1 hypothetical protein EV192_11883 [Actinocrispum wychmicini]
MTNEYGQQQPYPGQQPGYGQQPGQPGYGYPPQTPPGGQPVYAGQPYPQGAPGYGQMPIEKPGTITGAAVLAFIQAGITLITTIIITMGLINASSVTGGLGEGYAVMIAQFLGVVLLIVGSVQLLNGSSRGLFLVATGLEVVIALYWAIRFGSAINAGGIGAIENFRNSLIVIALGYAVLPVIALILGAGSGVGRYIQAKQGR